MFCDLEAFFHYQKTSDLNVGRDVRIILCRTCESEGRTLMAWPGQYNPVDCGPCPVCEGTGSEIIEVEPIKMEDLDDTR